MDGCSPSVSLKFSGVITPSDPQDKPVLIAGQIKNLVKVKYDLLKIKLEPRVSQEAYLAALASLHPSSSDTVSLYLNLATLGALPLKCSRHNAPARPHSLTKIARSATTGTDEYIVIVCEREEVFASACAIARAFPLYSKKTQRNGITIGNPASLPPSTTNSIVTVEFIIVGDDTSPLSEKDLVTLDVVCQGIRLAARIVDTPCNEMDVDQFLKTCMPGMKRDCGGAAAILGAFFAVVKQGFTQNLHAVFCLAENAVGPKSTRPDDIHTLYSGSTEPAKTYWKKGIKDK